MNTTSVFLAAWLCHAGLTAAEPKPAASKGIVSAHAQPLIAKAVQAAGEVAPSHFALSLAR